MTIISNYYLPTWRWPGMDIYKATKQQGTNKYILFATNSEVNICF